MSSTAGEKRKADGAADGAGPKRAAVDEHARARAFLRAARVSDLLGERKKRAVVLVEHNETVAEALRRLRDKKVASAPVVLAASAEDSESGTYLGMLDCGAILEALMRDAEFVKHEHAAAALKEVGERFVSRPVLTVAGQAGDVRMLFRGARKSSLEQLLRDGFLGAGDAARHTHRVALFDEHGEITSIVSQSDVARFLRRHADRLGALADATLESLGLVPAGAAVDTVSEADTAVAAFQTMFEHKHAALGVVDADGRLTAAISRSDLRGMTGPDFALLNHPVRRFLKIEDVLQQVHEKGSTAAMPREPRAVTCEAGATFIETVRQLLDSGVHRVFVTDAEGHPKAVVSLGDLMGAVLKWIDEDAAAGVAKKAE